MARTLVATLASASCCVLLLAGCGGVIDRQAASTTYRILTKSMEAAQRQSDPELAREAMPSGVLQLEAFALAYPDHRGFKVMYAETLCQYGIAFIFDDWEDASLAGRTTDAERIAARLSKLLGGCVDANLALLPTTWRAAHTNGPTAFESALPRATRDQVPALRWIASAETVRIALDPLANVRRIGPTMALLSRCIELAPGSHGADAELLLGALEAAIGKLFGGNDGTAQFAAARRTLGEGGLIVDVMMARSIAVARNDRALFQTMLDKVIAADVTRWPERRLANELAVKKARRYLGAADALFSPISDGS